MGYVYAGSFSETHIEVRPEAKTHKEKYARTDLQIIVVVTEKKRVIAAVWFRASKHSRRGERSLQFRDNLRRTAGTVITFLYVLVDDFDVLVAVRPGVLVPEADHVTELVNDDSELVAVLPDRDRLRAATSTADVGAAAGDKRSVNIRFAWCIRCSMYSDTRLHLGLNSSPMPSPAMTSARFQSQ